MSWSDFDAASALERDVLQRALPLVPTASDGSARVVIDVAADRADVAIGVTDVLGATPSSCIELLAIRPLLVGAAWKTLDLLLEEALLQGGFTPSSNRGWTIDSKAKRARAGDAKPTAIGMQAWRALMRTFAWTVDIRHSLVHRRAHTTPSGELVAVDRAGNAVGSLTVEEQEALARAALRAAELVIGATVDNRVEADLVRQLGVLSRLHAEKLPTVSLPDSLPEVVVILDPGPTDPGQTAPVSETLPPSAPL